jgi:predicted GNAT family N-acyltransferase
MSATLIGRLAVSTLCRGRRFGEALLFDALIRSYLAAREVGSALVLVRALDDDAERFYRKYGFIPLVGVPRALFIPTATLEPLVTG